MSDNYTDNTHEIKLAERARSGSIESFCDLYELYKDRLYRYALYHLGSPEDAEDAVSECVLAAWQRISSLRNPSAFGSWIFTILRNCCSRYIRKAVELRENIGRIYEASNASGGTWAPTSIELEEALSVLSDDEREIVLLSTVAGLSSREISEITGLTPGSVRSKLSRSLARMRDFLS